MGEVVGRLGRGNSPLLRPGVPGQVADPALIMLPRCTTRPGRALPAPGAAAGGRGCCGFVRATPGGCCGGFQPQVGPFSSPFDAQPPVSFMPSHPPEHALVPASFCQAINPAYEPSGGLMGQLQCVFLSDCAACCVLPVAWLPSARYACCRWTVLPRRVPHDGCPAHRVPAHPLLVCF